AKGMPCYFTIDAGPTVEVLVEKKNLEALKTFLSEQFSKDQLVPAFAGPGLELFETKGMDK
ncbi:diphosphomevalonate decarboxylase, partial [Enterococcus faecalis]|nr:diphosphomevalonate decarboxylase [Enterococcus faecalis]